MHDPHDLYEFLYDIIYHVESEEEVSSMARFVDGRMLPTFLPTLSIKEEKPEWEKLVNGYGKLLKRMKNN